jgi:hypothetical protein
MLSGGSLGLLLRPTKLTKSSKVSVEAIDKIAVVRLSNGTLENRSLRQLSGGERRRLVSSLIHVSPYFFPQWLAQRGKIWTLCLEKLGSQSKLLTVQIFVEKLRHFLFCLVHTPCLLDLSKTLYCACDAGGHEAYEDCDSEQRGE